MTSRRRFLQAVLFLSAGAAVAPAATPQGSVKIGMLKTMFRDIKPETFAAVSRPFAGLVESQTGIRGELVLVETPDVMRQQMAAGQIQLGAFHGFEFAWMKLQQPDLQPLMLVSTYPNCLKTVVVVAKDCPCNSVAELRGKSVALPVGTREHSRLFLSRRCRTAGRSVQEHFVGTTNPPTIEDALDDVVDGIIGVAVIDLASLQTFEKRKPGRYARLRIVEQSDLFAPSVISYHRGGVEDATLDRFRGGMTTAHKSLIGSQMMGVMRIQSFEPIPANFDQILAESVKNYPPAR